MALKHYNPTTPGQRQLVLVDRARDHREMLPLALGIGEPQVHPLDLIVLDHLEDLARAARHVLLPQKRIGRVGSRPLATGIPATAARVIGPVNNSRDAS